jgi:hypothetical protein
VMRQSPRQARLSGRCRRRLGSRSRWLSRWLQRSSPTGARRDA